MTARMLNRPWASLGWLVFTLGVVQPGASSAAPPARSPVAKPPAATPAPAPSAVATPAPVPQDGTIEGAFARAATARIAKRTDDALAELTGIEARDDASPEVRAEAAYQRGLILEEIGRGGEATSVYEAILRDLPRVATAGFVRLTYARRLARDGRLDDAVEEYRRLVGGPPALAAPALLEGGGLEERRGRLPGAIDAYRNLMASFPATSQAREGKAALAALCAKLAASPSTTPLADAFARAACQMEAGALRDAERTYESALKRSREREDRIELWMALGRCLVAQDRQSAAETVFRKVVRAAPDSAMAAEAQMEIVQGHLDRGRLPDAIRELERLAKAFKGTPQAAQALFMSGNCWEGLNNRGKAEDAYRKVLDAAPQSQWAGEAQRALLRILEEAR